MRQHVVQAIIAASSLGSLLIGCSDATVTDPNVVQFPDSAVSYRDHVDPFLTLTCGDCHNSSLSAGDIDLTNYSSLMFDRPNLVVPGQPDESLIMMVLEGRVAHVVGNINQVPTNHVNGMRTWIREGARNN